MTDSFGISIGNVHIGELACFHTYVRVHSPGNVICFVADPDVLRAWMGRDSHLGEERKKERKRKECLSTCSTFQTKHTEQLKAGRDCDRDGREQRSGKISQGGN